VETSSVFSPLADGRFGDSQQSEIHANLYAILLEDDMSLRVTTFITAGDGANHLEASLSQNFLHSEAPD
jgi:hypothetical protein